VILTGLTMALTSCANDDEVLLPPCKPEVSMTSPTIHDPVEMRGPEVGGIFYDYDKEAIIVQMTKEHDIRMYNLTLYDNDTDKPIKGGYEWFYSHLTEYPYYRSYEVPCTLTDCVENYKVIMGSKYDSELEYDTVFIVTF
jgi:hypothetical protein